MKAMKRMMALILTVIMTMAMAVTAFAAETPKGELTVNAKYTLKEQTIKLYKLFDLTVNGEGGHAYTVNTTYKDTLKTVLGMTQENPTDEEFYNAVKGKESTIQTFANDFTSAALTGNLTETASSGKITTDGKSYTFTGLDYGYYLVYLDGTERIQSSLVTVEAATGTTVNLKSEDPDIKKEADKASVEIGNVVTYTITGIIPDITGYDDYKYIIHDTLSAGLDFVADAQGTPFNETNKTVSVKIGEGEAVQKDITITGRIMDLNLSQWVKDNQASKGQTFTVTYYAKVNSSAVVTNTKNSATLEYGHDPDNTITTTSKEVVTPTYPLDINKTNKPKAGENASMLAGATFRLYKSKNDADVANNNAIKVTGSNGSYTVDPTTGATNMDMETIATEVGTGYNLRLNGLAAGVYWLVETASPSGYNKLSAPVKVTITQDGTVKTNWTVAKDDVDEADKIIDIQNSTGSLLPSTGGLSTMILTVISIVLVLGVAVSFIISRRRRTE